MVYTLKSPDIDQLPRRFLPRKSLALNLLEPELGIFSDQAGATPQSETYDLPDTVIACTSKSEVYY